MFKIIWTLTAELTFAEEVDFIYTKWNSKQVNRFINLVENQIKLLGSGLINGKKSLKKNVFILIISKQTSLAYQIDKENSTIKLLTFWNNKIKPDRYKEFF